LRSPHPISTLFPYTTLFRSEGQAVRSLIVGSIKRAFEVGAQRTSSSVATATLDRLRVAAANAGGWGGSRSAGPISHAAAARYLPDRKSTRLNSSHDQISYAV